MNLQIERYHKDIKSKENLIHKLIARNRQLQLYEEKDFERRKRQRRLDEEQEEEKQIVKRIRIAEREKQKIRKQFQTN